MPEICSGTNIWYISYRSNTLSYNGWPYSSSGVTIVPGVGIIKSENMWYYSPNGASDSTQLIGMVINGKITGDTIPETRDFTTVPEFNLSQNFPNPFNPTTRISYSIPQTSFVSLKVYDLLGREVTTLVNEEKPAGIYEVEFNASQLSSGVYFYLIQAGNNFSIKKMTFLK